MPQGLVAFHPPFRYNVRDSIHITCNPVSGGNA